MENIENRSKSYNPGANIVILPGREEKRTKETENWSEQFNQMRAAQQRRLAEDNEKMKVVQNRLLALVGGNGEKKTLRLIFTSIFLLSDG